MNTFQNCRNTSDAISLYLPQNLYLKPIARIHISVQLPRRIQPGKSISNWEIMEKLRALIKPEEFCILNVTKSTLEFIRFEAEIEDRSKLQKTLTLIDSRTIKLNSFAQEVKVRASEAKSEFPNRHAWDSFFRDAKNMNEMKPGERPDTIHFANLPIAWFVPLQHMHKDGMKPSQRIFQKCFEKFGHIRCVDIPICDPYRARMKEHITGMKTFTFDQDILFEGYIQFKDYVGFSRTMDEFRGMKLLRKENGEAQTVNIKVDFDKTKHLSEASIRRRQIVRERLIMKEREKEEKENEEKCKQAKEEEEKRQHEIEQKEEKIRRRQQREERRKARHLAQLKVKETDEIKKKIEKEEMKLVKAQNKLEAFRLVGELFNRIKMKMQADSTSADSDDKTEQKKHDKHVTEALEKMKINQERKIFDQNQKLNKVVETGVVMNILNDKDNDDENKSSTDSSSESDSNSETKNKSKKKKSKKKKKKSKSHHKENEPSTSSFVPNMENPYSINESNWYIPPGLYPYPTMFVPPVRGHPSGYFPQHILRGRGRGLPRGQYPRRRGAFNPHWGKQWHGKRNTMLPPELEQEYYKYFRQFLHEGRSRSHSYSYSSRSRSRSKSRRRSRSYSRSSRRSRSKSRRRSRSKSRRRRSRSKSRRRRSRSRSRSRSRNRRNTRSSSRSRSRDRSRTRSRRKSRSRSRSSSGRKNSKEKSRSPSYLSIDSSKFISPSRLRSKRSRSKSWSLPRVGEKKQSSWSKSPSSIKN